VLFNYIKGLVTENVSEPTESLKIHIIGETMHANSTPGVYCQVWTGYGQTRANGIV